MQPDPASSQYRLAFKPDLLKAVRINFYTQATICQVMGRNIQVCLKKRSRRWICAQKQLLYPSGFDRNWEKNAMHHQMPGSLNTLKGNGLSLQITQPTLPPGIKI